MNKFNQARRSLLQDRRAKRTSLRRLRSGNNSLKLPVNPPNLAITGKRQRKALKKWRRAQKDALESGLVSMQDIEMMAADNESEARSHGDGEKQAMRISVKKRAKLILKKSKKQGVQIISNEDVSMQ